MISGDDPPLIEPGEALVWLDPQGRLLRLMVVPAERQMDRASSKPDWHALFSAAHLVPADLSPKRPEGIPPVFADHREAWTGVLRDPPREAIQLRVEACSYRGAPVCFERMDLWPETPRTEINHGHRPQGGIVRGLFHFFYLMVAAVGILLARRHWRLQRGDAAPALRFASLTFGLNMATSLHFMPYLLDGVVQALLIPLCFLVFILAFRILFRRSWAATLAVWFLLSVVLGLRYAANGMTAGWARSSATAGLFWMVAAAAAFLFVLAWTRFGLLAGVVQWLMLHLSNGLFLLPDLSSWYAGRGLFALVTIVGIATYGFVVSTAGQRWFRDEILDR